MTDATTGDLLSAYDEQLRGGVELRSAHRLPDVGPLHLGVFGGGHGFITALGLPQDPESLTALAAEALASFDALADVTEVEWKTRAHDDVPALPSVLRAAGFEPEEAESIMIGEASALAVDAPLPGGVRLRAVSDPDDVRAASAMADEVFGDPVTEARVGDLLGRIERGAELWVAEADGAVVSTGRLEPVPGTAFAGIWGGATRPEWRHRGIYRALTAARARSAVARGVRWLQSDSTEYSRPILQRSGLVKVSETTPWVHLRARD